MKPQVKKRGDSWEVKFFGKTKNSYSSVILPTWEQAVEAAIRSGYKDHFEAAMGEQFLLSANRVLQRLGKERWR